MGIKPLALVLLLVCTSVFGRGALNPDVTQDTKAQYDLRLQLAEDARIKSEEARIEFDRHVEVHQC
jgi:hypothetical protein